MNTLTSPWFLACAAVLAAALAAAVILARRTPPRSRPRPPAATVRRTLPAHAARAEAPTAYRPPDRELLARVLAGLRALPGDDQPATAAATVELPVAVCELGMTSQEYVDALFAGPEAELARRTALHLGDGPAAA